MVRTSIVQKNKTSKRTSTDKLGGRIPLLVPSRLNAKQQKLYKRFHDTALPWAKKSGFEMQLPNGSVIGPFNLLLHTPDLANSFLDWESAQTRHSGLSEEVRQVIILTVGAIWNSTYELYAHTAVGRSAGLSTGAIRAIKSHRAPSDVSSSAQAAYRLIDVLLRKHDVPERRYAEAVTALGVDGVVAAVQLAGHYMTVSALLNAFRIPAPRREQGT